MNFMQLMATLGLDASKYNEGLDDAESRASSVGSAISSGLGVIAKVTGAAVGVAAVGVAKLTTSAVNAYGEYEQLAGGVEKIFGDSSNAVMAYADQAYMTAGLSANAYMETVTGFSASLLQGLEGDTQAAADIANQAITDMSDNANTYGTDMASIQNAYMGFAKGNYTMLDNLKLGYGGTATEMVRLINDSGILEEQIDSMDDVSFDQIILAIHEVQEQTNIAGTTANEAASTIQGSLGMLQGAWQNLVTGLGNSGADLSSLMGNVIDAAKTALENILPVASQALAGIAQLVGELAPIIAAELPSLVGEILPPLLNASTQIVTALVNALPSILSAITNVIPTLLGTLIPAILQVLPQLLEVGMQLLMAIIQGITENAPTIIPAIVSVVTEMIRVLTTPENLELFIHSGLELILAIAEGLVAAIPDLVAVIPEIIANYIVVMEEMFPEIIDALLLLVGDLAVALLEALASLMGTSFADVEGGLSSIGEAITGAFENIKQWFQDLWDNLTEKVSSLWSDITGFFSDGLENAKETVESVLNTISETFSSIFDTVKETVSGAIDYIKGLFDFEWSLPDLKLPHFSITGALDLMANPPSVPKVSIDWYAKAMDQPYLLNSATIFGASGGRLLGGGEAGGEMVYGHDQLLADIGAVVDSRLSSLQFIVPVYIGDEKIDEVTVKADRRNNFISGGR